MVASDRDAADSGRPWILLDAPGVPSMSGSPVYRRISESQKSSQAERPRHVTGVRGTLDHGVPGFAVVEKGVRLELLGVYAGAVGDEELEKLRLGRAFPIDLVEALLRRRERGSNPFPPFSDALTVERQRRHVRGELISDPRRALFGSQRLFREGQLSEPMPLCAPGMMSRRGTLMIGPLSAR